MGPGVSERSRRGLVVGGILGSVAAGVAAGLAVERLAVGRQRLRPDPEAREPFGRLPGRTRSFRTSDGTHLHVEEVGSGPLTVIFAHGFALNSAAWHYQRRDLADVGRLVFYDHRSHGRSARGPEGSETLDQLGQDLGELIDAVAPRGPVVLIGHSMGGMTVMSLAAHRPELFGERVVGVALVSTAAGQVAEAMLPLPVRATGLLTGRIVPRATRVMTRRKNTLEATRRVGSDLAFSLIRRMGFGSNPSPAQVEFIERIIAATPIEVIAAYVPTFTTHDKYEALDVVGRVPTLVLVGDRDRIVPPDQSKELAARMPGAELVVFDGAGHMLTMERAALVNLHLRAFLRRVGRTARASRGA